MWSEGASATKYDMPGKSEGRGRVRGRVTRRRMKTEENGE